jgi:hypothetical protein
LPPIQQVSNNLDGREIDILSGSDPKQEAVSIDLLEWVKFYGCDKKLCPRE